jgi:hypothetical protein
MGLGQIGGVAQALTAGIFCSDGLLAQSSVANNRIAVAGRNNACN